MNLQQRINKLPQLSSSFSFGKDIDNIHSFIFNETSKDKIEDLLRKWVSGNQPCVFGKLASKKIKGLDFHLSIVNSPQLYNDDGHLFYSSTTCLCSSIRRVSGHTKIYLFAAYARVLSNKRGCYLY